MRSPGIVAVVAVVLTAAALQPSHAQSQQPSPASPSGLGRAPTPAELRGWDLSVSPDGDELPPGSGTADAAVVGALT